MISTHAPLTRRDSLTSDSHGDFIISTHAPLTRRDLLPLGEATLAIISTHAPLTRRDVHSTSNNRIVGFLLTRLLRGATEIVQFPPFSENISTHAPLTRRDYCSSVL